MAAQTLIEEINNTNTHSFKLSVIKQLQYLSFCSSLCVANATPLLSAIHGYTPYPDFPRLAIEQVFWSWERVGFGWLAEGLHSSFFFL